MRAVAVKKSSREKTTGFQEMGTLRCDGCGDGTVSDQRLRVTPSHPGAWSIHSMKPEGMHAIEVLDDGESSAGNKDEPPLLRVEIKCVRD
jgi:hypothetical protein